MNAYTTSLEPDSELESTTLALKNCQKSNNIKSCMQCISFIDCNLRKQYVLNVYNSMNKGKQGGFEF